MSILGKEHISGRKTGRSDWSLGIGFLAVASAICLGVLLLVCGGFQHAQAAGPVFWDYPDIFPFKAFELAIRFGDSPSQCFTYANCTPNRIKTTHISFNQ